MSGKPRLSMPEFTPAIEKLFNRVLARVYRGSGRKKCSREQLLSLQHQEMLKKANHSFIIVSSRPIRETHTLSRKKQLIPQRSNYTHLTKPELQPKTYSSYFTQRRSDSLSRAARCKTESIKCITETGLGGNREDLMIQSQIMERDNKIIPKIKNQSLMRLETAHEITQVSQVHSEVAKDNNSSPCRLKQMEGKRRISNIIKTKNRLNADLQKQGREQPYFNPWQVDQNDDMFF